jgi:hypothetical protein
MSGRRDSVGCRVREHLKVESTNEKDANKSNIHQYLEVLDDNLGKCCHSECVDRYWDT